MLIYLLIPVCLVCHTGPVSVREQIKMINEKFAGSAGNQWQEPYPLHHYTLSAKVAQLPTCYYTGIGVLLWCSSLTISLVPGKKAARSSWEISLEDQTPTLSATLLRKTQSLSHTHRHTYVHTHIPHFHVWCCCRMDDLAVDSDEEVDYSKMDQVTTAPSIHQCCQSWYLLNPHTALWHHSCINDFYLEGD